MVLIQRTFDGFLKFMAHGFVYYLLEINCERAVVWDISPIVPCQMN